MVSISNLLAGTLLSFTPINEVASDVLSNVDLYNLPKYLFGAGPYFEMDGYGISTDLPEGCTLEQAHIFMRHGERYPTGGSGKSYKKVVERLQSYNGTLSGPLSFLNNYEFYIQDLDNLDMLTTPGNSKTPYTGSVTAMKAGASFRSKYNELFNANQSFPVFTASQYRCYLTADYWARGFLGEDYDKLDMNVLEETEAVGFNTLTPTDACINFNTSYNEDFTNAFPSDYLEVIAARLNNGNPELNVTTDEVQTLFATCAFEFSNTGESKFCGLFTQDEMITFDYSNSLGKYYTQGPGNPLAKAMGYLQLNATLALLKDENPENKIWASFSHDSDLAHFYNAIGLFDTENPMPNDRVIFKGAYKYSDPIVMGGRVVIEKFSYDDESYIRFLVNNAVIPLETCDKGPGFSCKLEEFEAYFEEIFPNFDLTETCGANSSTPQQLTFYWDYQNNPTYKVIPTVSV